MVEMLVHLWFIIYYIYGSGFHYIYGGYYIYGWLLLHLWLVVLLFSNYWMRLSRMWRIMQIWRMLSAEVDNILQDLHNSFHLTKAEAYLLEEFLQNFGLFLGMVSRYNICFSLKILLKSKQHPIPPGIRFAYSCIS